jgi:hypothetical protein
MAKQWCYTMTWDHWQTVSRRFPCPINVVRDYRTGIARVYLSHFSVILRRLARETKV